MFCLRLFRGPNALSNLASASRITQNVTLKQSSARTFTSLTPIRPSIFPSSPTSRGASNPAPVSICPVTELPLDVSILPFKMSAHPAMQSMQIRCAPRDTFSPSHFVRKRRHGFLNRQRSRTGRMILKRRRAKKRSTLSH